MVKQVKIIAKILEEVNIKKSDFNEVKKQIRKYLKQNKDEDFILNYIVSNKYLFYNEDEGINLQQLYYDIDTETKRYNIKEYLQTLIALCWYLSNKVDDLHKYQIQMINENYKDIENPRKEYQKVLGLNRSVGKNFESYLPYLDIYSLDVLHAGSNDTIDEMDVFLDYYNIASENNKDFRQYAFTYHPLHKLITYAYHLFLENNELYPTYTGNN